MRLKILFVDDEQNIISGIRRMLYQMRDEWELYFALSGSEALQLLDTHEMDVIITDMRMPVMDGAALLERVKNSFPPIIRIILSGHSDKDLIFRASQSAHQFLAKPIEAKVLKNVIERLYNLQKILSNPKIIRLANQVQNLPSLPDLYTRIETEISKENPSIKIIDDIISQDMIMTAKILHVVNSAFFGLPQKIINPLQAINFLGLEIIKTLVLMVNLFSTDSKNETLNLHITQLWEESLQVANLSKQIAIAEKFNPKLVEECFIGSLLHDIGKLVLWQIEDYFPLIEKQVESFSLNVTDAEYSLYETSHAEVGAYLLGVWGLPDSLIEIVNFHHKPSQCPNNMLSPLTIIHASDHLICNNELDELYIENLSLNSSLERWKKLFTKENNNE